MSNKPSDDLPCARDLPRVKRVKQSSHAGGRSDTNVPSTTAETTPGCANRFSKEIYSNISTFVFVEGDGKPSTRTLLALSHLNHTSRETVLELPHLWARSLLYFDHPQLVALVLERTKSVPLAIVADIDPRLSPPAKSACPMITSQQVAKHMRHIKDLTLIGHYLRSFITSLTRPAPVLETVKLSYLSPEPAVLPVNFLWNTAPCLKLLILRNVSLPISPISIPSIQRLEITAPSNDRWVEANALSVPQLLAALSGMPNLEALVLQWCIPYCDPRARSSWPGPVSLPKLTHLTLRGAVDDTVEVWRMLCVPPTITLEMECDRPDSAVFDHLIPDLTEFFDPESGAFEDGPIRALEVTQTTPLHNLSITVRCEDATRREPRVVIKLLADPAVCDHDEWIRAQELCRAFPFRDLTSLSLDVTHAVAQGKPFFDGLAEASSLKELHLRHAAAQAFCSAVIAISHEDDDFFLPKLEIISLAMVNFRGKVYQEGRGARRSFYKVFHDWVTRRRESELGLKGLSVKTCTLDPQWFLDLKSLIFETTWDGVRDGHNVGTEGLDDEKDEEEGKGECEDYAEEEEEEEGYDSDDYDEWADRRNITSDERLDELIELYPDLSDYDDLML